MQEAGLLLRMLPQSSVTSAQMTVRNILLATDFSPCSARALDYALGIASRYEAHLYLFHCVNPAPYNMVERPDAVETTCDDARRELEGLVSELRSDSRAKDLEITVVVEAGDLASILSQAVEDLDLGLIVVGTHGRTGWRKLVLGSVAEAVVDHVSCPVLCVGPSADRTQIQQLGPQNILVASEDSARSKLADSYASSLAHKYRAGLTVIDVLENRSGRVRARVSQFGWYDPDAATADLSPKETKPLKLPTEIGTQSDLILRVADHTAADLIVLALPETHRFADRFLSSNSYYRVICDAACPVLTVHLDSYKSEQPQECWTGSKRNTKSECSNR